LDLEDEDLEGDDLEEEAVTEDVVKVEEEAAPADDQLKVCLQ
jgi:hypothetical protein